MKYFTKEWYTNGQYLLAYESLRVSKKAEVFSEEYFNKLYKKRLKEKMAFFGGFDDYYNESVFQECFNHDLEELKEMLPDELLAKISDLRVLALNIASSDNYRWFKQYCKQKENEIYAISRAYQAHYDKIVNLLPDVLEEMHMHDCKVVNNHFYKGDFIMDIDSSGGFYFMSRLVFKNAKIIESDINLDGVRWLYDEIYITDTGYEMHILFCSDENKQGQMIISFDEVITEDAQKHVKTENLLFISDIRDYGTVEHEDEITKNICCLAICNSKYDDFFHLLLCGEKIDSENEILFDTLENAKLEGVKRNKDIVWYAMKSRMDLC